MKILKYIAAIILCLMLALPVHSEGYKGNVDAKEIVFDHIKDSYDWHITQFGDKHITIPILIIVRSSETGWHVFSSSRLQHGHTYDGFKYATEGVVVTWSRHASAPDAVIPAASAYSNI